MWYKLPVKERMDLMRTYRKGGYSYSDMVKDYNDSYEKFGNGGKKGEDKPKPSPYLPIETYNPSETTNQHDLSVRYNAPNQYNRLSEQQLALIEAKSKQRPELRNDSRPEQIKKQDKELSDKIQREIDNPLIYNPGGQILSYASNFEGMSPEDVAHLNTSGFVDKLGWASNKVSGVLVNEMVGGAGSKLIGKSVGYYTDKVKPNLYKINPNALTNESFNNPNSFYRQIDNTTFREGEASGLIKGKQAIDMEQVPGQINLKKSFGDDAYFNKGRLYSQNSRADYIYEVQKGEEAFIPKLNNRTRGLTTENTNVRVPKELMPIQEADVYKKHWWKGYEKIADAKKKEALKPVIGPKPLPKELEPYISSKQLKATKEEEIYESFLSNEARSKKSAARTIKYDKNGNKIN